MRSAVRPLASAAWESLSLASAKQRWRAPLWQVSSGSRDAAKRVLVVVGTRPECIKLAPLVRALRDHPDLSPIVVNSGQHLQSVRGCFTEFGLRADIELDALPPLPHLAASCAHLNLALTKAMRHCDPGLVIVQGDTLTAYSAARAAHDAGYRVAHVEAGLRTDAVIEPFPEEWFRRRIARYAWLHFAPSRRAVVNLLDEGVDEAAVHCVGNTGIDSLRHCLSAGAHTRRSGPLRPTVLVTLHRRANYDRNSSLICDALVDLAAKCPELRFLFPVHPNPRISAIIRRRLTSHAAFDLVDPMPYRHFIECAARAALIISDSGGIQEEVPHLGTPLLVPRTNTERPECLTTGFVRLVAVDRDAILRAAQDALAAPRRAPLPIDEHAPFGSGDAAQRIVAVLEMQLMSQVYA
jgi:UDP-N-acetylglucosamine 2-epimerase (non-hydrolysing)